MNRKNTILVAVLINIGLLAVLLLIATLTTPEEISRESALAREETLPRPLFDEQPLALSLSPTQELPLLPLPDMVVSSSEPVVHKLPPLVAADPQPEFALPTPPKPEVASPLVPAPTTKPLNEITVKKGDSLEKLARVHHTTVDAIIKLNHLPSSFLKIGQVLKMPGEKISKIAEKKVESGPEYYTIKVGENPWAIAMRHNMKLEELLRLNNLNEEKARKLKAGDRLRIR